MPGQTLSPRDLRRLEKIVSSSKTAVAVFQTLLERDRVWTKSDLRRLRIAVTRRYPGQVVKPDFDHIFAELESMGMGEIHEGDKSKNMPPVFEWRLNFKEVAQTALGLIGKAPVPTKADLPVKSNGSSRLAGDENDIVLKGLAPKESFAKIITLIALKGGHYEILKEENISAQELLQRKIQA